MRDLFYKFCVDGFQTLSEAALGLFWPAIFFLALSIILKRSSLIRDLPSIATETSLNIRIILFNVIVMTPFLVAVSQAQSDFFAHHNLVFLPANTWDDVPAAITILVAIIVGDFTGYWRHRLEHTRFLWPSHAVHHSDTAMTWLTLDRFHPINRFTTLVFDSAVLLLLGFPPFALIANNLTRHYYGYFIHADLPWTYGKFGRVLVSPAMHRWHHAADTSYYHTNFATVFSVFDWMFGTYRVPGECNAPLGLRGKMKPTLLGQLSYAFLPSSYLRQPVIKGADIKPIDNRVHQSS